MYSTHLYRDDEGNLGELWYQGFYPSEYTSRLYGNGDQGWYDPHDGTVLPNDHQDIYQYNIDMRDLANVFHQEEGTIYWLMITAFLDETQSPPGAEWGWKTTLDHWNDDAVVGHLDATGEPIGDWEELYDPSILPPNIPVSLDMAFVITPEPATLAVLAIGGLIMLRSRKLRRNH